jgi:hypothetical protein
MVLISTAGLRMVPMSDHALGVTGLIVGVSGIVIGVLCAYYFYLKARERVDPRYLLRHEPLVESSSGAMTDVSVLFKGNTVTNLNRCSLVIWNRGNRVITRDAVAQNDKVRVCFSEGATALGAGVEWSSRPAVDLSAHVSDDGSAVIIDFAFLDADDGGVVEILYQGDPQVSPTVTGSIMGAPRGIQVVPRLTLGGPGEPAGGEEGDEEEEKGPGSWWKGWILPAVVLCSAAIISALKLGSADPLSIVLYTLNAELILAALFFGYLYLHLMRGLGSRNFWRNMPQTKAGKNFKIGQ